MRRRLPVLRPALSVPAIPGSLRAAGGFARGRRARSRALAWARSLDVWLIAGLGVLAGSLVAALVITVEHGQLLGFGDSTSHLEIARRVLDGRQSGFRQLGVHWLPLFQVLEVPFSAVGALYRSAASGVIVSFAASLLTARYLYRLMRLVGCPGSVAFLGLVMLAASPSFLYVGVIPMQPAVIMAATTVNIYYLMRWTLEPEATGLLVAAGLTLTVATLAHFDTWILMPLELVVVVAVTAGSWHSRQRIIATVAVWSLAGLYGLAFFLAMNVLIFGTPDAFLLSGVAFGHGAGQAPPPFQSFGASLGAYPWAAYEVAGPTLVLAGMVGLAMVIFRAWRQPRLLVGLLLLYPLVFYSIQPLLHGQYFAPNHNLAHFVHLRYAATIFPALVFLAVAGIRWRIPVLVATIMVIAGAGVMLHTNRVATWIDARSENGATFNKEIGPLARQFGALMSSEPQAAVYLPLVSQYNDRFEFLTGGSLSQFIDATGAEWRSLVRRPWRARALGTRYLLLVDFPDQLVRARNTILATNARLCLSRSFSASQPLVQLYTLTDVCPLGGKPGPPPYLGPL